MVPFGGGDGVLAAGVNAPEAGSTVYVISFVLVPTNRWVPPVVMAFAPSENGEPETGVSVPSELVRNSETVPVEKFSANTKVLC